jgi:hypothetical protein
MWTKHGSFLSYTLGWFALLVFMSVGMFILLVTSESYDKTWMTPEQALLTCGLSAGGIFLVGSYMWSVRLRDYKQLMREQPDKDSNQLWSEFYG